MSPSIVSDRRASARRLRWRGIPGPERDPIKARLLRLYRDLARRFGPQHWWPGRTPFEIATGAILAQHTAWTNAARAIAALRRARLLSAERVDRVAESHLAETIRAAGTYRLKAQRLKAFTRWLVARHDGDFAGLRAAPLASLRAELLAISGLGPETADAILLYAAHRPVFVADAYARRALARHGLISANVSYDDARRFIEAHLPSDPALFNEFHALLVALGKQYCRTVPDCTPCPLRYDLPTARRRVPTRLRTKRRVKTNAHT
jgi:endonuclease III related protein